MGSFFTPPTRLEAGGVSHWLRGCRRDTDPARQGLGPNRDHEEVLQESCVGMTQAGFTEETALRPLGAPDAPGSGVGGAAG